MKFYSVLFHPISAFLSPYINNHKTTTNTRTNSLTFTLRAHTYYTSKMCGLHQKMWVCLWLNNNCSTKAGQSNFHFLAISGHTSLMETVRILNIIKNISPVNNHTIYDIVWLYFWSTLVLQSRNIYNVRMDRTGLFIHAWIQFLPNNISI